MKPNRYMLMLAVLLLASGGGGLRAGDAAGDKAVTASFTDTSDVLGLLLESRTISRPTWPRSLRTPKQSPRSTPEAPAAVSRTDTTRQSGRTIHPWPGNRYPTTTGWPHALAGGQLPPMARRPWSVNGRVWKSSSPFYDVDGLTSDGYRTANFWVSGPESEATMAGLEYYNGPGLSFDVDYRRFLHRLGVKPIGGHGCSTARHRHATGRRFLHPAACRAPSAGLRRCSAPTTRRATAASSVLTWSMPVMTTPFASSSLTRM